MSKTRGLDQAEIILLRSQRGGVGRGAPKDELIWVVGTAAWAQLCDEAKTQTPSPILELTETEPAKLFGIAVRVVAGGAVDEIALVRRTGAIERVTRSAWEGMNNN